MIKFFRHIRRNLMETGKTGKYFKYAIGEIILVVIGILIALQINNWNEHNKNLKNEQLILSGIKQSFSFNLEELNNAISILEKSYNASLELMELMGPNPTHQSLAQVDSLLSDVINYGTYDPSNGTIDEVINSGKLSLIQNNELRNGISNWSRLIADTKKDEDILNENLFNALIIYLNKKANYRNLPIPSSLVKASGLNKVSPSKFIVNYDPLLTSLEFENLLNGHALNLMYTIYEYSRIQEYLEGINTMIDQQLK